MKLRIKGNSLRIRVSRPEIDIFTRTGIVSEQTQFPGRVLIFGLQHDLHLLHPEAIWDEKGIWVKIPEKLAKEWTDSEQVGFSHEQALPTGGTLRLLIEKDFQCLHREGVDESDLYHNPNASYGS